MTVQFGRDLFNPEVHFGSPKVSKEEHCSGHPVMHYLGLFVDPVVDAPASHEFLYLVSVSGEDFWLFANHFVQ